MLSELWSELQSGHESGFGSEVLRTGVRAWIGLANDLGQKFVQGLGEAFFRARSELGSGVSELGGPCGGWQDGPRSLVIGNYLL